MKVKLNDDIIKSFEGYLNSNEFKPSNSDIQSIYWAHHSKLVNFKIKKNYIYINADSGFYVLDKKYSLKSLWRLTKDKINSLINFSNPAHISWFIDKKIKKVFELAISNQLPSEIKFNKTKNIIENISELKKVFPFKNFLINFHIVKTYYWLNILSNFVNMKKKNVITEIGGGNGNFISLLNHHFENKCIINIDLPKTLLHCMAFTHSLFPNAKILFPHEVKDVISDEVIEKYDFIFLTTSQIKYLKNDTVDIYINTGSFCEMSKEQIKIYFDLIQRTAKKDGFFLNVNRAEKIPIIGKASDYSNTPPVNMFVEYPFNKLNKIIIFEICQFFKKIIQKDVYTRLEKINK